MVTVTKASTSSSSRQETQPLRRTAGLDLEDSSRTGQSKKKPRDPVRIMKSVAYFCASSLVLDHLNVYSTVLRSGQIRRTWWLLTLALSLAMLILKTYVELYQGQTKKVPVTYKNFRQETHAVIILFLLTSLSLHVALWPVYGGPKTILIGICLGYGVVFQSMLLLPVHVQNALGMLGLMIMMKME